MTTGIVGLLIGWMLLAGSGEEVILFDGKSLAGWEGDANVFRLEQGAVVGGSLRERVEHNDFLCTKQEFSDFELRVTFKLLGNGANAGIQFRSRRVPGHFEVSGYQADMGGPYWGCLYDESRRNKVLARPMDPEALRRAIRHDDWNEYRIRAEGRRIQLWINDVPTVDYLEEDASIESTGLIGLQIHGGPPSEAWYKDVRLTPILPKKEG
jgi:hypothetical protein